MRSQKPEAGSQKGPTWMPRAISPFWLLAFGFWLLPLLAGCAGNKAQREADAAIAEYRIGDYASAQHRLTPLAGKTDENFVLNNLRLGSVALANYDLDAAEGAFLRAYEVLNSVGVNNGGRTLGAVLISEGIRVWRGEPFERAMANFYLGLVYYLRHDYANARAAFENALFKLRDYGEAKGQSDQYREAESNFALAYVMLAKSHQRLGREDLARKYFQRAAELRPDLAGIVDFERNARSNLLLVLDFGYGPQKVTNRGGTFTGFAPNPMEQPPPPRPIVKVDGHSVDVAGLERPPVDLLVLAQDRKWQSLDTIRAVKSAIGTGLMIGGMVYGTQHDARPEIVLGTLLGGMLLKATSQADVRQWEMLPRNVYLLPLEVASGTHDISVEFPAVPGVSQEWRGLPVPPPGQEATYYFRMQRGHGGPFSWPPPTVAGAQPNRNPVGPPRQ